MLLLVAALVALQAPPGESEGAPADLADGDAALFELETELVATASRAAEPLRFAPASLSVVPRAEIDAFGFASTADALVGVRGISLSNDGIWPSLGIRGFNRFADYGNRVQVQIDGHIMNDDWLSSSYVSNDQLTDLAMIEKIEVLRGPGSALYGTGALFGVVNLITPSKPPAYRLRAGVGLVETLTGRLHVDGGAPFTLPVLGEGGAWASVSASGHVPLDYQSDAYLGTPGAEDGVATRADRLATWSALAKVFAGDVTLAGSFHRRDRGYPTGAFEGAFGDPRNTALEDRGFVELRYEPVVGGVHVATRAFVDGYTYTAGYTSEFDAAELTVDDYTSVWGGLEARATAEPVAGLRIVGGTQYEIHPAARWFQTDFVDDTFVFHSVALYALADWRPMRWLLAGLGARLDARLYQSAASQAGAAGAPLVAVNPRAHLIWLPSDEDTVKLLAGAFRAPSIYELQFSTRGFDFEGGAIGVNAETVGTVELEYTRQLPLNLAAVAALYGTLNESLIQQNDDGFYVNDRDPVFSTGAEIEVRRSFSDGVVGSAFYAWQRVRVGSILDGVPQENSPEHLAGIRVLVPVAGERLGVAQRVVIDIGRFDREGERVAPAVVWDITLSGKAPEVAWLCWSVGVRNVLDQYYEHPVDSSVRDVRLPQPGRNLRAELSFAF